MTGMPRLMRLTLQNFRGVGATPLELDLSAPLTVLVAPNGTGKSSVCFAAQWLMTGKAGPDESYGETIQFRMKATPEVEALMKAGSETKVVSRRGRNTFWGVGPDALERIAQEEFLVWLTGNVPGLENNGALQAWVGGTHWLYGNNLNILIDSDNSSAVGRRKVFADLFGVGHLEAMERQCAAYLRETREAYQRLTDKLEERRARRDELRPTLATNETVMLTSYIEGAARLLNYPLEEDAQQGLVHRLAVEATARTARKTERRETLRRIEAAFTNAVHNRRQDDDERSRLAELEARREGLTQSINDNNENAERQRIERDRLQSLVAKFGQFQSDVVEAFEALKTTDPDGLAAGLTERQLRDGFPDIERPMDWLARGCEALEELLERWPDVADNRQRQQEDERELSLLGDLPDADTLPELAEGIARLQQELSDLDRRITAMAGPIEQLKTAGKSALDLLGDIHHCPLCAHDWEEAKNLRRALEQTLDSLPAPVLDLERQRADLRERLSGLTGRQERGKHARLLRDRIEAAMPRITAFRQQAESWGVVLYAGDWRYALSERLRQLTVADKAGKLLLVLPAAATLAGITLDADTPLTVLVETIDERMIHLRIEAEKARDDTEIAWNDFINLKRQGEADRETLKRELQVIQAEIDTRQRAALEIATLWQSISDGPLDEASLWREVAETKSALTSLAEARTLLREAEACQHATESQRRLREVEAEIKRLESQYRELGMRRDRASSLCNKCVTHRNQLIEAQFRLLRPTVEAYFLRMHANRFITGLDLDTTEDKLEWLAKGRIDDGEAISLRPGDHFSDGQRQDLALAIFLARAGSLGGTFFLDEPLVHLDELNRVAVLDILRMLVTEQRDGRPDLGLVLTTNNNALARHLQEKFCRVNRRSDGEPPIRIIELEGNPEIGVQKKGSYEQSSIT